MKILTLTNLYPNPFQPLRAPFNRQLFRALSQQHPVQVISPIAWTDEWAGRRRGGGLPRDRRLTLDGMVIDHPVYLYPPKILRHLYGRFYCLSVRNAFQRALDEFRPDIVFAPWAYPDGWAAVQLGHDAGLPVVVKVHGSDIRVLTRVRGRRRRTAEAIQRADGVIAVCHELERQVVEFDVTPNKVRTIISGIDSSVFHPGSRGEARAELGIAPKGSVLLFIGNLVPVKGLDVLIDACSLLLRTGVRFTCHLIGQGPLRSRLEARVAKLGLQENVKLLGSKPHHQLPTWFRAADIFVLPSRSEGLPTVLLEALASGTPFVASRVGGIPELAHLGPCRLVRPDDPRQLAEALRLMVDAGKRPIGDLATRPRLQSYEEEARELSTYLQSVRDLYRDRRRVAVSAC
jgi:glycosyltransferase involved in cell wall biosynthesis